MAVIKGDFIDNAEIWRAVHNALINNGWTVVSADSSSFDTALKAGVNVKSGFTRNECTYKGIGYNPTRPPYIQIRYVALKESNLKSIMVKMGTGYNRETNELTNANQEWHFTSFDKVAGSYHICVDNAALFMQLTQNNVYQTLYLGLFLPLMTPMQYQLPMTVKGMRWVNSNDAVYTPSASEIAKGTKTSDLFNLNYDYESTSAFILNVYTPSNLYQRCSIESFIEQNPYAFTTGRVTKMHDFETIYRSATVDNLIFAKNVMISDTTNFPYTILGAFKFIVILFGQYNIGSTVTLNGKKYRIYLSISTNVFYGVEDE